MPAKTSDLLDRYLQAVKFWLPRRQQRDILNELAEDLHSQIEERESALGHPLDQGELSDILKRRGAPMRVASGYLPNQRLINPALMPLYRLMMTSLLVWVTILEIAHDVVRPLVYSAPVGHVLLAFLGNTARRGLVTVGLVTVIFALIERLPVAVDNWDPLKLPRAAGRHESTPRSNDFASFVSGVGAALVWVWLMWQRTGFRLGDLKITLAPIWGYLFWLILLVTLFRAGVDFASFLRPALRRTCAWLRIALNAAAIPTALLLLQVRDWAYVPDAQAAAWIHQIVQISLIATASIALLEGLWQWRLLRRTPPASLAAASLSVPN